MKQKWRRLFVCLTLFDPFNIKALNSIKWSRWNKDRQNFIKVYKQNTHRSDLQQKDYKSALLTSLASLMYARISLLFYILSDNKKASPKWRRRDFWKCWYYRVCVTCVTRTDICLKRTFLHIRLRVTRVTKRWKHTYFQVRVNLLGDGVGFASCIGLFVLQ